MKTKVTVVAYFAYSLPAKATLSSGSQTDKTLLVEVLYSFTQGGL